MKKKKNYSKEKEEGAKHEREEAMGYSGGSMKKVKRGGSRRMGAMNGSKNGSY